MHDQIIKKKVSLKHMSSFQIGGRAEHFAEPETYEELISVLDYTDREAMGTLFFGLGSNLLFPDNPDKNTCYISLRKMNRFSIEESSLTVSAGVPVSLLAILGILANSELLDFTYLLPGTIGAGLFINARYLEREMADIATDIEYLDLEEPEAGIRKIAVSDCNYAYKSSIFQSKPWLITGARFILPDADSISRENLLMIDEIMQKDDCNLNDLSNFKRVFTELYQRIDRSVKSIEDVAERRDFYKHFDYPSAGSVFKNNRELGKPVGQIIDELKLKGKKIGGAMISPYHGNLIINAGEAKSSEVLDLIDLMSESIYEIYNIAPETEIRIIK